METETASDNTTGIPLPDGSEMRSTMMDYPLTLVHLLERAGRLFSKVDIISRLPDRSVSRTTYGEFHRRARALAEMLTRAGLKRGDRVATLMWNHSAHLEAYFGIPVAGGVLHPLNLRLHPDDIAYIAKDAEDRFLIVDGVLLPLFERLREARFERVFVAQAGETALPSGCESYEAGLRAATGDFAYPKLDEYEAAGMCHTSGTTGRPRAVVYSHRATVLHCYNLTSAAFQAIAPGDVVMPVVPMFHANAWGAPYGAVMAGAKLVFPGPHLDAESLLELCERERVTFCNGVPAVWLSVLQALEREPGRFRLAPGLRIAAGGSAAPEAMIRAFDRHGITVLHAWGMTETSPVASAALLKPYQRDLPEDERYALRATQGYAAPFVDLRVVDDGGQEVAADGQAMGELQVRGPYVAGSYYGAGPDPERFTTDGWLRTGDVATIDAEGYIKIADRLKDLIKSGGEWISSVELENALMGHPAVAEAAVIAVPHARWGERPLAVVVLKPGARATGAELAKPLAGRFAKWWLPDDYVFVEALPRSSTGKFLKAKLRETYRGRFGAAGAGGETA